MEKNKEKAAAKWGPLPQTQTRRAREKAGEERVEARLLSRHLQLEGTFCCRLIFWLRGLVARPCASLTAFASGWWADSGRKEPEPPGFPGARPNRDDVEVVDWRANLARRLADPATSLPPTPEEAKLTDPRPPRPPLGPDPGAADPAR